MHPVVESRIKPGNLSWLKQGDTVVWAEAGTGRVLGWTDYGGYTADDAPIGGSNIEVMAPPSGGDVEIYLLDHESLPLPNSKTERSHFTLDSKNAVAE